MLRIRRGDLTRKLARKLGVSYAVANTMLTALRDLVADELYLGNTVSLDKLGSWEAQAGLAGQARPLVKWRTSPQLKQRLRTRDIS